jgi:hypothetical protein
MLWLHQGKGTFKIVLTFCSNCNLFAVTNFNTTVAVITLLTDAICSAVVLCHWWFRFIVGVAIILFENNLSVLCYQKSIGSFTRPACDCKIIYWLFFVLNVPFSQFDLLLLSEASRHWFSFDGSFRFILLFTRPKQQQEYL